MATGNILYSRNQRESEKEVSETVVIFAFNSSNRNDLCLTVIPFQPDLLVLQAIHSLMDSAQDWIQQQFSKLPGAGRSVQLHVICEQLVVPHVAVPNDITQWQGVHGELHLIHHISVLYIVGWDALPPPKPTAMRYTISQH